MALPWLKPWVCIRRFLVSGLVVIGQFRLIAVRILSASPMSPFAANTCAPMSIVQSYEAPIANSKRPLDMRADLAPALDLPDYPAGSNALSEALAMVSLS